MAKRRTSRQAARRRHGRAHQAAHQSHYRRKLRYEPLEHRRLLALVTVNTLDDTVDLNDGRTSLREAIFATNLVSGPDTIEFSSALTASGPATIVLTQGELRITDDLTIQGPGANLLTIDASGNDPTPDIDDGNGTRVFWISDNDKAIHRNVVLDAFTATGGDDGNDGAIATTEDLTVSNVIVIGNHMGFGGGGISAGLFGSASLMIIDCVISENASGLYGGGIDVGIFGNGNVTIRGSIVSNNSATHAGGGINVEAPNGGAKIFLSENVVSDNSSGPNFGRGGGIHINGGTVEIENNRILNNFSSDVGGGIWLNAESPSVIRNSTVSGNSARFGGGIATNSEAKISIVDSVVSNNSAAEYGGGVYARGTTEIIRSTITDNAAGNTAGGVWASDSVTIEKSTVAKNSATGWGGGIYGLDVTTIIDSTINDNTCGQAGGGVVVSSNRSPGIRFIMINSTVSGNTAQSGGGVHINGLAADYSSISHSTITNNTATGGEPIGQNSRGGGVNVARGVVRLDHVIVAGNRNLGGVAPDIAGLVNAHYSLIGVGTEYLGPLTDNGGPTMTHALLVGSPAIDAGDPAVAAGVNGVPQFDQRGAGHNRVVGPRIDIGAVEGSGIRIVVDTSIDEDDGDLSPGDLSLREAIGWANSTPVAETIVFDERLAGGTIFLTQRELVISGSVTIDGPGAGRLTIDASGSDPTPTTKNADGSRVFNIRANFPLDEFRPDVTIRGLMLTGGDLQGSGGAIQANANLTLDWVQIVGNAVTNRGGGLHQVAGTFTIMSSTFANNTAFIGGGILKSDGDLFIQNSTFSGNTASVDGGGIHSSVAGGRGSGSTTVRHSTIVQNTGNGLSDIGAQDRLRLEHTLIAGNKNAAGQSADIRITAQLQMFHNIIGTQAGTNIPEAPIGLSDEGGNLIGGPTHGVIDPRLGPLADNGGHTLTHALLPDSPAINAGDPAAMAGMNGVPLFDQRGEPFFRVHGGRIDIGAFESQPNLLTGDYNVDGTVDTADYALWRNTRNSTTDLRADGNGDGIIDDLDRLVWRSNFGRSAEPMAAATDNDSLTVDLIAAAALDETFDHNLDVLGESAGAVDHPSVIVTTLLDVVDFNDGLTSLREAIFATNLVSGPHTIEFSPALTADSPATILLTQGELRITDGLTINGPGPSLLAIDASGNDPTPAIDDGKGSRVFNISDGLATSIEVTLTGLSFTGGDVSGVGGAILSLESLVIESCAVVENTIRPSTAVTGGGGIAASLRDGAHFEMSNSVVSNNQAAGDGGGIFLSVGTNCTVQIDDSRITGNHVPLTTVVASGGGIAIRNNRGSVTITDCEILDNSTPGNGGGIAFDGNVTIERSSISGNSSLSSGGGISHGMLSGQSGALTLVDSEVANNTAVNGGGIRLSQSASTPHTIVRSKILDNTATGKMPPSSVVGNGGGILTVHGSLQIVESTIDGNHAHNGGGVFASFSNISAPEFSIENSTITNNTASQSGGGLYLSRGGIIRQSTVSKNSASDGAGIYTAFDTQVFQSTVVENSAEREGAGIYLNNGSLLVDHSILAKNTAIVTSGDIVVAPNSIVTARHSLIGDNGTSGLTESPVGSPDINGNLIGGAVHGLIDPLLGPLADNGGPTITHALLPDSPAINAGNLNARAGIDGVPLFDQREKPFDRVVNGRIDIGAFEFQEASDLNLLVDTLVDESDGNYERGDLSLREAVELANQWPSIDTIQFDPALTSSGAATVLLTQGELRITDDLTINGPGADLLTIDASGNDPTPDIDDGKGSRVFYIDDGLPATQKMVSIAYLTIAGGDLGANTSGSNQSGGAIWNRENLVLASMTIAANHSLGSGGGIQHEIGTLRVLNSTISNNVSEFLGGGIFAIDSGPVVIEDSTISDNTAVLPGIGGGIRAYRADLDITNSHIVGNVSGSTGGGIAIRQAALSISQSTIVGNSAQTGGGGIYCIEGHDTDVSISISTILNNTSTFGGGGVYYDSTGIMTIVESQIRGNSAQQNGGGLYVVRGEATISDSLISDNSAAGAGGGIASMSVDRMLISHSTIAENSSGGVGGGVWRAGTLRGVREGAFSFEINASTIRGNTAGTSGGGVFYSTDQVARVVDSTISDNTAGGNGGGIAQYIFNSVGSPVESLTQNTTISGNRADGQGGGLWVNSAAINPVRLANTTITANLAGDEGGGLFVQQGDVRLVHSIIAGNDAPFGRDLTGLFSAEVIPHYSLIGSNQHTEFTAAPVGSPDAKGNLIGGPTIPSRIGAKLGPLANNGGFTMTHALLPGSPAINMGDPGSMPGIDSVPQFDQRGERFTRVYGGRIDIGAFEWQPDLPGDYNFDSMVDAADYAVWRATRNSTTDLRADGNGDEIVDLADREIWRANFGRAYAVGSSRETDRRDWIDRVDEVFQLLGSGAILPD